MILKILRLTPPSHASMRGGAPQIRKIKDSIKYQYRIGDHYDEDIAL
jgi:hypothetical protein